MKFDFKKTYDQQKALEYLDKLILTGSKASLTKIHPKRSVSQNAYLHVLFSLWGSEFGYTIDEAKQVIKHALGYIYHKTDSKAVGESNYSFMVKTSGMDSKELTIFIDRFRNWSADTCGLYLPSSEEFLSEQIYFENLIENQ